MYMFLFLHAFDMCEVLCFFVQDVLSMPRHYMPCGGFPRVWFHELPFGCSALWNQHSAQLYCVQVQVSFIVMGDNVSLSDGPPVLSDDAPVSSLLKRQCVADDDALSDTLPVSFLMKRPARTRKALSPRVTWLRYTVWLFCLPFSQLNSYWHHRGFHYAVVATTARAAKKRSVTCKSKARASHKVQKDKVVKPKKPRRRATVQKSKVVKPKTSKRRGDIEFPDPTELKINGSTSPWQWASMFDSCLKKAGHTVPQHTKVQVFTEFTGSTCAEAAAESIGSHMGISFDFVSAGDINRQCRTVIQSTRQMLTPFNVSRCNHS